MQLCQENLAKVLSFHWLKISQLGNLNNVANYRGITLVPIISNVLEGVINALCLSCFETDDHQFGFKKGKGCTDAIYLFTATVDHFIEHGSSVFVAALDISKAFDKVDHNKLFTSLGEAGILVL